ncbi:MAG: hypothetical protein ACOC25_08675 [Alkalispirochaetaceae bacterium]
MKIVVNDEAIDFTLQGEKRLGEIIPPLREWLSASDFAMAGLTVDGKPVDLEKREEWEELELKGIGTLTVSASSLVQEQLDGIETAMEFLVLLRRIVQAADAERLAEALMEYNYLREVLPAFLSSRYEEGTQMRDYFDELLDRTGAADGALPSEGEPRRELLRGVDSLISLLETRAREIVQPGEEFLAVARAVAGSLESIEEVPVLLQTGEGANAMRRLAGFTGLVERLVRLYPLWAEEHEAGEADFEELNEVLAELIQALGDEDSVLVGDLVEYEVVPKIETFLEGAGVKRPTSA